MRGTAADVRAALAKIPLLLSGKIPDPTGIVAQIQLAVGIQALSLIREAFLVKAAGGTDEAGIQWAPLKEKTIAYRRHPGLRRKKKGERPRGMLSASQDKVWRGIYASIYRKTRNKGHAAAVAWVILKQMGAKTILKEYGGTKVEILRDTGILLNSLSPGVSGPGDPRQIFRLEPGKVVIGTNVPYAIKHQTGIPGRLPQRKIWPETGDPWPEAWKKLLLARVGEGVKLLLEALLK